MRGKALCGMALGAGLMYVFDPNQGRRRRARLRDAASAARRDLGDGVGMASRDLEHRAHGLVDQWRSRLDPRPVDDVVVEERVRARLGRYVQNSGLLDVTVEDGRVTLRGPIVASDVDALVARLRSVPGLRGFDHHLEVFPASEQRAIARVATPADGERSWTPATRLLAGVGAGFLTVKGFRRRGPIGLGMSTVGLTLLGRAVFDRPVRQLAGVGDARASVHFTKTIEIDAPIARVFDFWNHPANFGLFMSHIREVRDLGGGRSHWVAHGPAHISVEWDAETTRIVPNKVIAWRSVEGSPIGNAGIVRFAPGTNGGTRVTVSMSYAPPAGVLGHAVTTVLGASPKAMIDDDMLRLKSFLETGRLRGKSTPAATMETAAKHQTGAVPGGAGEPSRVAGTERTRAPRPGETPTI